ncbi:MAG: YbhB/YbcL family Raf kinase inhibitor-like protein [Candidatus Thermoplasmatota archaeon]|jgi:hypothetical protein
MPGLKVTSSAYSEGQAIPAEFTCDGSDQSPPLVVEGIPPGAAFLAIILDDPDAPRGTWTHWTLWDLPAKHNHLPAGVAVNSLGARQGMTTAGTVGYHGPCPPSGTHRYIVHAFATAKPLGLPAGASVEAVHAALAGVAMAKGTLTGRYARS